MKVNEWLEVIDYRVNTGSTFEWKCYGDNAYVMDWQTPENDYDNVIDYYSTICFNSETKEVYAMEVFDENNDIYYAWHDTKYIEKFEEECIRRQVQVAPLDYTIDLKFNYHDILEVLKSIYNNHKKV